MRPTFNNENINKYKKELFEYFASSINWLKDLSNYKKNQLRRAFNVAFKAHQGQFRKGGDKEPYITHPVEVAIIVAKEMNFGITSVISALLHDVVEDSDLYDIDYIDSRFGKHVATIVDGVTKITNISGKQESKQLETFKKLLFTIPKDYRVVLIKIADRLHNMRTMEDMPGSSRRIKSSENLYIYAPIANMVGLHDIKKEIYNLSFKYLHPENYQNLLSERELTSFRRYEVLSSFQKKIKRSIFKKYSFLTMETIVKSW